MFAYQAVDRPYPGLRPFEPWETSIFFGRDIHIDRLQDILKSRHFLTVTGPSGSGKSSLVRAGLLPALPLGAIGTGTDWRAVIMRPGDRPISSLVEALCDSYALGPELDRIEALTSTTKTATVLTLEAELHRGPLSLIDLVKDLRQHAVDPDFNLLILVDQFEEIFTYAEAGIQQADESDAFVNLLLEAGKKKEARIFVVVTMRTDFLGACTRFLDFSDEINRSLYLTPRLSREQLTQAIAGPAALYGLKLPEVLVVEYVNASLNEPDQLPVLQHALARRWDQSRQLASNEPEEDVFQAVSNLGQALSEHADTVYQSLTDEQRLYAQWLFRAITEQRAAEAGGQMVRRPQSLELIAKWTGCTWPVFIPILKAFADPKVNFLTYKGQPGEPEKAEKTVIDISHEAVMRQWISLKGWISSEGKAAQEFSEWHQRAARKDSGNGSYLSGADLSRAEIWLKQGLDFAAPSAQSALQNSAPCAEWASRYSQDKDPEHTFATAKAFILQSRVAARFLKRLWYSLAAFLTITCLTAAWFGYNSYQQTIQSAAKSLWFPFNADSELTAGDGANALSKVAGQDKNIRLRFIEGILYDDNNAKAFSSDPVLLLRASIQSDLSLRNQLFERLRRDAYKMDPMSLARIQALLELDASSGILQLLHTVITTGDFKLIDALEREELASYATKLNESQAARVVAQYVEAILKTADPNQLQALGAGFAPLAGKLDESQAAHVVAQYVEAILKTIDPEQLWALEAGLAPLAGKLNESQAARVVAQYVEAILKTADPNQLQALGAGLAPLAGKLDESQAAHVVAQYVEAILKTIDPEQLWALGAGLASLAGKLDESQAARVVAQYVEAILKTIDPNKLRTLGAGLAPLAGKLDESQAAHVVAQYVEAILKTIDPEQLWALEAGLAPLAGKLDESQAARVVAQYVEAILKTTDYRRLQVLGTGLAPLAGKLDESQAAHVVAQYVEAILKTIDPDKLKALGAGLAPLAGKLDESQAAHVVAQYVEAILKKTTDYRRLQALGAGLASLAGKLDESQAARVVAQYVEAILKTTDYRQLQALGAGLAPLAGKLDESQAARVVAQYVEAILMKTTVYRELQALGAGLAPLAGKLDESQAARVVAQYVEAILKTTDYRQLQALGAGLAPLAGKLDESQAVRVVAQYVEAILKTADPNQLQALGAGFAPLAGKLDESQAARVVTQYVEAILKTADPNQLRALGAGLAPLAGKLDESQAARVVAQYVEAILKTTDFRQLQDLGAGLAPLAGKLDDTALDSIAAVLQTQLQYSLTGAQQAALAVSANALIPRLMLSENLDKTWLRMSAIPFIDREAVAASIRKHYADAPHEDEGIWAFLKWANGHFGMNRPDSDELMPAILKILLLPLLVLLSGGVLLQVLSGRNLVTLQLNKLDSKKDQQTLGLRFSGYTADQVEIHWSVLGADERVIEQRFLIIDLIFAPVYSLTFLYALFLASEYLGEPWSSTWLVMLICAMVLADWAENIIQLQQLKRLDQQGGGLQKNWIRVASAATQIKLMSIFTAIALSLYFSVQLVFF